MNIKNKIVDLGLKECTYDLDVPRSRFQLKKTLSFSKMIFHLITCSLILGICVGWLHELIEEEEDRSSLEDNSQECI